MQHVTPPVAKACTELPITVFMILLSAFDYFLILMELNYFFKYFFVGVG